jgi:hypothetical protein
MWQPIEEKKCERELIRNYACKIDAKIIKLQEDNDDQETDGIIEKNGTQIKVEARRKGYPNHRGRACSFKDGWKTCFLLNGIFLNERTLSNHKDKGFDFIVEIKGFKPRVAILTPYMVDDLLRQPYQSQKSTNSGVIQSVKSVPLNWFIEY